MASGVHGHNACCHPQHHERPLSERLFHLLEKVSAVALGAFAAYASMELFLSFFLAGVGVGVYQSFTSGPQEVCADGGSACSQGLLEQLTKVKLPPLISLGANLAITWCHIDHHTTIFVPIIGLSMGAWAAQSLASLRSRVAPVHV